MNVVRIICYLLVIAYLIGQASLDRKTGMVLKTVNNVLLLISTVCWAYTLCCFVPKSEVLLFGTESVLLVLILFMSSFRLPLLGKVMQPADAKALSTVYLSSSFIFGYGLSPIVLLITLLFGHTYFIISNKVKGAKKDERKPYFPSILFGYASSSLCYLALCLAL